MICLRKSKVYFIMWWIIVVFLYVPPMIITGYPPLEILNKGVRVLAAIVSIYQIFQVVNRRLFFDTSLVVMMCIFLGWIEISNISNGYGISDSLYYIINSINLIGICCIILNQKYKGKLGYFVDTMIIYTNLVCCINFLTQLLFPNAGLYSSRLLGWQPYFFYGNANSFAFIYIVSLGLVYYRANEQKSKGLFIWGIVLNIILIISCLIGDTSTGFGCMLLMLVLNLMIDTKIVAFISRHSLFLLLSVSVFVIWFLVFGGWRSDFIISLIDNTVHEKRNYLTRGEIWEYTIGLIQKKPLFGWGTKITQLSFSSTAGINKSAHNTFLQIALFGGLTALITYFFMLFLTVSSCIKNKMYGYRRLIISFFLYMLLFMFEQSPFHIGLYILMAFMVVNLESQNEIIECGV